MSRGGSRQLRVIAAGTGLVETMVALALAMVITLASLRVMAMSNDEYLKVEQAILMDEQAEYLLELTGRLLQQLGHVDPSRPSTGAPARLTEGALQGFDNAVSAGSAPGVQGIRAGAHFSSDLIAMYRPGEDGQRALNCAGSPAPPVASEEGERGWNSLYVAAAASGEHELRCRYWAGEQWSTQSIATGVAGLQFRYGVDSDRDGLPNDFLSASSLRALDANRPLGQPSAWTRVVAVHLALLMRSPQPVPIQQLRTIDLFGSEPAVRGAGHDPGTQIKANELDAHRLWRSYDAVIFLNNSLVPAA